ncbi:MAG: hypothetical protein ACKVON_07670, partial [Beijerinckiaceae bacterium]
MIISKNFISMKKIIILVISTIIITIVLTSSVIRLRKFLLSRIDAKVAAEITVLRTEISVLRTQSEAQRPTVPPSALPPTPDQNSFEASGNGDLSARIATLEKLALSGNPNVTNRLPLISDYRGSGAAVFAMIDAVGPYRKNGLYEVYGGSFRERRSGPIRVMEAQFEISHDEGW